VDNVKVAENGFTMEILKNEDLFTAHGLEKAVICK
jgi:hypothetical protein